MRLLPLLSLVTATSLTVGLATGIWFGQERYRYLSARTDLVLRIGNLQTIESGNYTKLQTEHEMHIIGNTLVLYNSPSWFEYFKHGPQKVPESIVEARKAAIMATFQKLGGDSLMDETISQLVDAHLRNQELFRPH